jgi:hypothetical protein
MILLAVGGGVEVCADGEVAVVEERGPLGLKATEADVQAFATSAIAMAMGTRARLRAAARPDEVTSRPPDVLDRLALMEPGSLDVGEAEDPALSKCGGALSSLVGVWHHRRGS